MHSPLQPPASAEVLRQPDRPARPARATGFELSGALAMTLLVALSILAAARPAAAELQWLTVHVYARLAGQ